MWLLYGNSTSHGVRFSVWLDDKNELDFTQLTLSTQDPVKETHASHTQHMSYGSKDCGSVLGPAETAESAVCTQSVDPRSGVGLKCM